MSRQRIDHQRLLADLLPGDALPPDVRRAVELALRSASPHVHELASRRAIDALVARGVLRREGRVDDSRPERLERYVNRHTGDTWSVRWTSPRRATVIKVPIPPSLHEVDLPISVVAKILSLDAHLFGPEENEPASYGDLVGAALDLATDLTGADFVTFVPAGPPGEATLASVSGRMTPEHAEVLRQYTPEGEPSIIYLTDPDAIEAIRRLAPSDDFNAVALAAIGRGRGELDGFLEVWSRRSDFLDHEGLVALSLLADRLRHLLDRANVLEHLVFYDSLTGLYNRHFFDLSIEKEMARARRVGRSFALAIVDIDDFKAINTDLGYNGGNEILEQVGRLLQASVRPFDVATRWGGEEFALVLTPPVGVDEATIVCTRIREAIAGHTFVATGLDMVRRELRITVSVGVSVYPEGASTAAELWTMANAALHTAKGRGKNQVVDHRSLRRRPHPEG
jgi:diguanylate cyclase (GGDEF)-like protein